MVGVEHEEDIQCLCKTRIGSVILRLGQVLSLDTSLWMGRYIHHVQHVFSVTEIVARVIEWSSNSDTVGHCGDGRCVPQDSDDLLVHCLVVASIQISSL